MVFVPVHALVAIHRLAHLCLADSPTGRSQTLVDSALDPRLEQVADSTAVHEHEQPLLLEGTGAMFEHPVYSMACSGSRFTSVRSRPLPRCRERNAKDFEKMNRKRIQRHLTSAGAREGRPPGPGCPPIGTGTHASNIICSAT